MTSQLAPEIAERITRLSKPDTRIFVAIAGPPGAGKSTLSETLKGALEGAEILPMDGFHLDNETLRQKSLLARKGAPQTFDTAGLLALLETAKVGGAVSVPVFDRDADCVVPGGGMIFTHTRIILVEGNYLLLNTPGWQEMQRFWDLTLFIDVPDDELESRLLRRWLDHGLSPEDALRRYRENDALNVRVVKQHSSAAEFVVRQT